MLFSIFWRSLVIVLMMVLSASVFAARLEVTPDTNFALTFAANFILYAHIIGGAVGLLTGLVASVVKKGAFLHRRAGRIFLVAMFVCYGIGALVAPFLSVGQRPNFVAAILALYLLISGVQAARKRPFVASSSNGFGLAISLAITFMGILFMYMGSQSETGTVDGSPPQAFVIFIIVGALASLGELRMLIIKKLSEPARIYRHLWRMCFSFFFASGSLFIGQPQVFPEWFNASPLPGLFAAFPLMVLVVWTIKTLLKAKSNRRVKRESSASVADLS